ncbi:shikimate dehydrogenase [Streptomyces pratensis]|uniref:shikimate dehydrogenase family protein n=1 Tax=Streptomyces pratensis TaxID=1169025 RepID=UPI003017C170
MDETTAPAISGATRLFAVIGDPVAQVKAPALLNPLFARLGRDAVLFPVHAEPRNFAQVITGLQRTSNVDGLLITVPHKIRACAFADELGRGAAVSGSANAMRREEDGRWRADNFDGQGFVAGLGARGHAPGGKVVRLWGAGGAGRAIAAAVLEAEAAHLLVHDPDRAKREELRGRLEEHWPGRVTAVDSADGTLDCDIAVNATPLGMRPSDPLPFDPKPLGEGTLVADIVMEPRDTPLLRTASAHGLPTLRGHHMLDQQLGLYETFFGLRNQASAEH